MYNLSDFISFKGNEHLLKNGEHKCLAWSRKDGYYFTQAGFCVGDVLIVAIEEV